MNAWYTMYDANDEVIACGPVDIDLRIDRIAHVNCRCYPRDIDTPQPQTRTAHMEEIERRRDNVLAEYNSDLPIYEPR